MFARVVALASHRLTRTGIVCGVLMVAAHLAQSLVKDTMDHLQELSQAREELQQEVARVTAQRRDLERSLRLVQAVQNAPTTGPDQNTD